MKILHRGDIAYVTNSIILRNMNRLHYINRTFPIHSLIFLHFIANSLIAFRFEYDSKPDIKNNIK